MDAPNQKNTFFQFSAGIIIFLCLKKNNQTAPTWLKKQFFIQKNTFSYEHFNFWENCGFSMAATYEENESDAC